MKRILAAVTLAALVAPAFAVEKSAPFEQNQFDRGVTTQEQRASAGSTQTEGNVWASDFNFIAPAQ
jgi:hypothetical protein